MAQPPDIWTVSPKSRTPKKLEKLAVDAVARFILRKSLPLVENWFSGRATALDRLKAQKIWYWNETTPWLGYHNSTIRQLLSKALTELSYPFYYDERFKAMIGFVIQTLFCCSVGHLEVVQLQGVTFQHNILIISLLRATKPFYNTGLYDTCLNFPKALPLIHVMVTSPYLKHLHLRYEGCSYALDYLERTCPGLELLRLEIDVCEDVLLEPSLYKAFFRNLSAETVKRNLTFKENVPISFQSLKVFDVRYDRMPFRTFPKFFSCLLHYYPNIRLQLSNLIALAYDTQDAKLPSLRLSFLLEMESSEAKRIKSFTWNKNLVEWKSARKEEHPIFNSAFYVCELLCQSARLVHEEIHRMRFQDLKLVYYNNNFAYVGSSFDDSIGSVLQELHVFGTLINETLLKSLVEMLNKCPVLQILSLFISLENFIPFIEDIKPLRNLNVLSVFFVDSKNGRFLGVTEERNICLFLDPIINSAPNLTLLEIQGRTALIELIDRDLLRNIKTLSLTDWMNLTETELLSRLDRLISLRFLILNVRCDYDRYLRLKRQLQNTDLDVIFKKERLVFPMSL